MPVQYPDFPMLTRGQVSPIPGMQAGQEMMQKNIMLPQQIQAALLANQINQAKAKYAMPMEEQALKTAQQQYAWNPQIWKSQIGLQGAQAGNLGSEAALNRFKLQNPGLLGDELSKNIALSMLYKNNPQVAQLYQNSINAEIAKQKAMAQYYGMGGIGMGVGGKEELAFQNYVGRDNPQLGNDPNKIYEAANVLRSGGNKLSDGTPLNPMSPAAQSSLDRITKYGTTSPIITQGIQASQAEAELPIFNKAIDEGVQPYGTTVFGTSPQQIADSVNIKNHAAQKRLGNYLAAQQLLYDKTALQLKINALPPGVTLANEVKKLSYQSVNEKFPMMSAEARQIAADRVTEVLMEGLKARRSVGTGAASIRGGNAKNENITKSLSGEKVQKWGRDDNGKPIRLS